MRSKIKSLLGPRATTWLRCLVRGHGLPRWGNLRRTAPFSKNFGSERGTPVDRFYLHRFLAANCGDITGNVLEIQASGYTKRYGRNVRLSHSIDINPAHGATFTCDLAEAARWIPPASYDCFLLPNTLQHLRDLETCLKAALTVVKPGGVILASAAGFIPLIPDGPDYWRLSAAGWHELTARVWKDSEVQIESHGNCLAVAAATMGLAWEEFREDELLVSDPLRPVLITLRCQKPGA